MSYLKIKGDDTKYYVSISPFTSQHGYKAVRFVGDKVPTTDLGFEYYSDDDTLISDLSDYTYEYRQNEYTVQEDIIELPTGTNAPLQPSAIDKVNARVSKLNTQVNEITPYKATENAYVYTDHVIFNNVPVGVPTITMLDADGKGVPFEVEEDTVRNRIIVKYKKRKKLATVNLTIQ